MRVDLWWRNTHGIRLGPWHRWYRDHQVSPDGIRPDEREVGRFRNLLEADRFAAWQKSLYPDYPREFIALPEGQHPDHTNAG